MTEDVRWIRLEEHYFLLRHNYKVNYVDTFGIEKALLWEQVEDEKELQEGETPQSWT
jgi:hypothetical protein